ncbi:hypothetical protein DBR42_17800 [Pelomonas sp. HMWF004]|nr:hypothetical protein DBR42_17800 [Pelomonas sp. HMWF004]
MEIGSKEEEVCAEGVARIVVDLTGLLAALQSATVPGKPWQRQLLRDLEEGDRHLQVLRLTIAMNRRDAEVLTAACSLVSVLTRAASTIGRGRADQGTRDATRLLAGLGRELQLRLEEYPY